MNARAEYVAILLIVLTSCFTLGYIVARTHLVCEAGTAPDPWAFVSEGK